MVLIIDNYDSFVYTLMRYVHCCSQETKVVRNDAIDIESILKHPPEAIILSPGPGRPEAAGICVPLITALQGSVPMLGVCLGHQAIVVAYQGVVGRALKPMHGKAGNISVTPDPLFTGIPSVFPAGRYHSLCAAFLPACLQKIAVSDEGEVMAIRHRQHPLWGVQFHPESILTPHGMTMIENFIKLAIHES